MASPAPSTPHDYFSRKVSIGRIRPQPGEVPGSPRTPVFTRSLSGLYGSPGGSFRNDDENSLVVEIGHRHIAFGIAGEATPRCIRNSGPNEQRRVGDYRQWQPDYVPRPSADKGGNAWGADRELWLDDIRDVDLGIVEDKFERVLRRIDNEDIMLDDRKKRLTLVVSSELPRPILSIALSSLFNQFQPSTITVFPTSISHTVGSGLRSGLVIDVGWTCTVASAIYEYREVNIKRSVRGSKALSTALARLLRDEHPRHINAQCHISFEQTEEVLTRFAWCQPRQANRADNIENEAKPINIPLPYSQPPVTLSIPFKRLSEPAESVFFGKKSFTADGYEPHASIESATSKTTVPKFEDNDYPLPLLIYTCLLELPIDVRKACIPRLIITGGASALPGFKARLLSDLKRLINVRGWDRVNDYGNATKTTPMAIVGDESEDQMFGGEDSVNESQSSRKATSVGGERPSRSRPQGPDQILAEITRQKTNTPLVDPEHDLRIVESLGPWSGGSVLASLRVKGVVEIEKDMFTHFGLAGGTKEKEGSKAAHRQSFVPGPRPAASDRPQWTLGIWA